MRTSGFGSVKTPIHKHLFDIACLLDTTEFTEGEIVPAGTILGHATDEVLDDPNILLVKANSTTIEPLVVLNHEVEVRKDRVALSVGALAKGVVYEDGIITANGVLEAGVKDKLKARGIEFYTVDRKGNDI